MIKIVSDSTCDLTKELYEEFDIAMVPLHIVMGDKEYRDQIEITPAEIFKWADANKTTPKTSAVAYGDVEKVIKPILDNGDEIIVFTISESMSTTGNVFRMVAEDLHATDRVHVFNTWSLSNGVGLLAINASIMVREGKSAEEILAVLEEYKLKLSTSFVIDTLTYLARGGRCKPVVALAGGILKLHPKIFLENGAMDVGKKYRGNMSSVVLNYAKDMEEEMLNSNSEMICLVTAGLDEEIKESVKDYIMSLNHFDRIVETTAGGVISSHCGPGTLGLMYIKK